MYDDDTKAWLSFEDIYKKNVHIFVMTTEKEVFPLQYFFVIDIH